MVWLYFMDARRTKSFHAVPCFYFIFERETETETECEWGRGREREGYTESEAGSRLRAVSTEPDAGLQPTNHEIMT